MPTWILMELGIGAMHTINPLSPWLINNKYNINDWIERVSDF